MTTTKAIEETHPLPKKTDEIPGIRKSEQYFINVAYRNPPYINYSKTIGDTAGLEPVTANVEMERGLVLRVRVTEKGSGRPVRGPSNWAPDHFQPQLEFLVVAWSN